jgi:hypothetical protein
MEVTLSFIFGSFEVLTFKSLLEAYAVIACIATYFTDVLAAGDGFPTGVLTDAFLEAKLFTYGLLLSFLSNFLAAASALYLTLLLWYEYILN